MARGLPTSPRTATVLFFLASAMLALSTSVHPGHAQPAPAATVVDEPGEVEGNGASGPADLPVPTAGVSTEPLYLTEAALPIPPTTSEASFTQFMAETRKEDPTFLAQRWDRWKGLWRNRDLQRQKESLAFLMTPREKFCRSWNLKRAYEHAFLDIRYGVTISGPYIVGRMTTAIDVKPGDKVLEIGTGSGYQSAVLAYLTNQVFTIEIIEPLASETDRIYTDLAGAGYPEFRNIKRKADDGYFGWEENAPYDKIIVTCGIDHIPPPLLQQLKVGGTMCIPVGPPGAQVVLKVTKALDEDGEVTVTREDIYKGRKKAAFVPLTKKGGGTHYQK